MNNKHNALPANAPCHRFEFRWLIPALIALFCQTTTSWSQELQSYTANSTTLASSAYVGDLINRFNTPGIEMNNAGEIFINGTRGDDFIEIYELGTNQYEVQFNGIPYFFSPQYRPLSPNIGSSMKYVVPSKLNFQGSDGDDWLFNYSSLPLEADGWTGNDVLVGGYGDDFISGGDGNDFLVAGAGCDTLYGEAGDDCLDAAYAWQSYLLGGSGNDWLFGGDGSDYLWGEDGFDTLQGRAGDDYLAGGADDDWLEGGSGDDQHEGETGSDTMIGYDANDTFYADAFDIVYSPIFDLAWELGWVGEPIGPSELVAYLPGSFQVFEYATIYFSPEFGPHEVHGAIREHYVALGGHHSYLGLPKSNEMTIKNGQVNYFEGGKIIWRNGQASDIPHSSTLVFDSGPVVFEEGIPMGGWAELELFNDGSFRFHGHFHDSGFPSYDLQLLVAVVSASGNGMLQFAEEGHLSGTLESGSRDHDWDRSGTLVGLAENWNDLEGGQCRFFVRVDADWDPIFDDLFASLGDFLLEEVLDMASGAGGSNTAALWGASVFGDGSGYSYNETDPDEAKASGAIKESERKRSL